MSALRILKLQTKNLCKSIDELPELVLIVFVSLAALGIYHQRPERKSALLPASYSHSRSIDPRTTTAATERVIATSTGFGWLTFIASPLYAALRLIHDHGIGNWGWSIVVLTVAFNLLIIWPRIASMKLSLKMMRLQPKIDSIKKKYANVKTDDRKRAEMNKEMMDLYRTEGADVFGGCLPSILQMPLLFAFMSVLRNAAELHQAKWLWLPDLALPDPLHILPLLIMATMALTQSLTPASNISRSQKWVLAILMPAVMGVSLWHYASGLSLYWVTGNIFSMFTQFAINRTELGKEVRGLAAARERR